ncbi:hypothetical protein [Companilactobacillus hulinensis]|uniref:hypothetical protein n=1 Tax=Companilactobacillus hulinensis TaxID=2486007 RepID=UPI0013DD90B3|nr:hypothetical protein [Companilactobacillus hulinensis]
MDIKKYELKKENIVTLFKSIILDMNHIPFFPSERKIEDYKEIRTSSKQDIINLQNDYLKIGNDIQKSIDEYDSK